MLTHQMRSHTLTYTHIHTHTHNQMHSHILTHIHTHTPNALAGLYVFLKVQLARFVLVREERRETALFLQNASALPNTNITHRTHHSQQRHTNRNGREE